MREWILCNVLFSHLLIRKLYPSGRVLGNVGLPKVTEYFSQKWIPMYQWEEPLSLYSAILHDVTDITHDSVIDGQWIGTWTWKALTWWRLVASRTEQWAQTQGHHRGPQRLTLWTEEVTGIRHQQGTGSSPNSPSHPPLDVFRTEKMIIRCWAFLRPPQCNVL